MALLVSFCCVDTAKEWYACSNDNTQLYPHENYFESHLEMNCQAVIFCKFFSLLGLNTEPCTYRRTALKGKKCRKFLHISRDGHFAARDTVIQLPHNKHGVKLFWSAKRVSL